jgi:uncharacterized membrane protein YfcA
MPLHPLAQIAIIAAVAFIAAMVSSMSGGGSSMIATPIWLMLGFPLPVAIASNSVNGSVWTLVAARNYLRGHDLDWRLLFGLATFGLVGAYAGTQVILNCNPHALQRVIGGIILSLVALAYFRKDFGLHDGPERLNRSLTSLAAIPLGFYEAFFGSGNGILTSALLTTARGFKLPRALGYYYVISFAWGVFAAIIYIRAGNWNLSLMVPSAIGSICGAWVGSHIGAKRGGGFVKTAFIIAGSVLGLKLLLAV